MKTFAPRIHRRRRRVRGIRQCRLDRGWTIKRAAKYLRINVNTLTAIELGTRTPDADQAMAIAQKYGVSVEIAFAFIEVGRAA